MSRLLAMLSAGLLLAMSAACDTRPAGERAMAEIETQEPIFALLKEQDPAAYGEIKTLIEGEISRGGQPDRNRLINQGREILGRVVQRRVATASDATTQRMAALVANQAAALEANPQACVGLLNGTAGDLRSAIPVELQEREKELYRALLTEPRSEQRTATEAEGVPVVSRILQDAQGALGLSEQAVQLGMSGAGPARDMCRINAYLLRRLSEMPPAEGAPVFRLIMRMGAEAGPSGTAP